MNPIEQKIYNRAKEIMSQALVRAKLIKTDAIFINIPFCCDGCVNYLVFDKNFDRFTKIISSNVKSGHLTLDRVTSVGYFDDVEMGEIDITLYNEGVNKRVFAYPTLKGIKYCPANQIKTDEK